MTLEQRIVALAQAIGADIKAGRDSTGSLTSLSTTAKNNIVSAINELHSAVQALAGGGGAPIDDNAGDGATAVTWSADKIFDSIELAKTAVKNELSDGAGTALDTLAELAAALGDDPNFAQTIADGLGKRVRVDAVQTFTEGEKTQARQNISAYGAAEIGNPDADLAAAYNAAKT